MPTRRLVVALTLLLVGVFGVGIVTALGRLDEDGTPSAQPSATFSPPGFTETPAPTDQPEPTGSPSAEPTAEPTVAPTGGPTGPTVAPTGTAAPGRGGGKPGMPNTGAPAALAVVATLATGSALAARRFAR